MIARTHFLNKQLRFFLLEEEPHYVMQRVSLPLSPPSFMMQFDFFFQHKRTIVFSFILAAAWICEL